MSSTAQSPNWREVISGQSTITGRQEYLKSTNGALNVSASNSGVSSTLYTGQRTVNTSQVQLSVTSKPVTNGIIIKALSTNAANIYVGTTGVTTTTGDILEPGESRGYPISNVNLLYIISGSSITDVVSYEGS